MADKSKKPTAQEMARGRAIREHVMATAQGGRRGPPGKFKRIMWFMMTLTLLIMISLPTVVLLGIGLAPAMVAFIIDRSDQKYATFCVGGLNFCGVFPYLFDLWFGIHSIETALNIALNPFTLAVMYGSAAFGWMIYMAIPPVVSTFLTVMSQQRLQRLRARQRKLIEEWGEEVAGTAPAKPVAQQTNDDDDDDDDDDHPGHGASGSGQSEAAA
ncbi:MAG: acyl-CoA synthetase [Rhodospirillales bacterium]